MAPDEFKVQKELLRRYAKTMGDQTPLWDASAARLKDASMESIVFTGHGDRISKAYDQLLIDYVWYAWRIGQTMSKVEKALKTTADNYGKAEKRIADDIRKEGTTF